MPSKLSSESFFEAHRISDDHRLRPSFQGMGQEIRIRKVTQKDVRTCFECASFFYMLGGFSCLCTKNRKHESLISVELQLIEESRIACLDPHEELGDEDHLLASP